MAITIQINGKRKSNSLVHKGSNAFIRNTLPDVCKTSTPGGPVPIPYPVIFSFSKDLKKGTKTVKADRKKMIAVKGSQFSRCTGDEPGKIGGIKSNTNMKEAKWLMYSFNVKMESKNACRLADKMTMNHANTMGLAGVVVAPVIIAGVDVTKAACECVESVTKKSIDKKYTFLPEWVRCCILGTKRHKCVDDKINGKGNAKETIHSGLGHHYSSKQLMKGRTFCKPDIIVTAPGVTPPPDAKDMKKIYDLKFQCADKKDLKSISDWDPNKEFGKAQREQYKWIHKKGGNIKKPNGVKVADGIGPTKEGCS